MKCWPVPCICSLSHKSNLTILFEHVYENSACKNILFSLITLHMTMFVVIYSVVKHVELFTALLQISRKINQKKIQLELKLLNRAPSGIAKPALINGCSFIRWELFAIKIGCHSHLGFTNTHISGYCVLFSLWALYTVL